MITTPSLNLGFGLGLRREHYAEVIARRTGVDWFEVITENFIECGGRPMHTLEAIRQDYPLVLHGVALSIGSSDPLDDAYLKSLATLIRRIEPAWISDHLCWTGIGGINTHDLLPVPYTEEALAHIALRVRKVQDFLGRQLLLENPSSYLTFSTSTSTEADFLRELAARTDCHLLLDVNNVYVSARNHGFDPYQYIDRLECSRVKQIHLAGHQDLGGQLLDTHDAPVCEAVWDLYTYAITRCPLAATMIERDGNMPPLVELEAELARARTCADAAQLEVAA